MHFSFFAVIVTLAASITSASACQGFLKSCMSPSDCCADEGLQCRTLVSKSCLFCVGFSPDDSPFPPYNFRRVAINSARSKTLESHASSFAPMLLLIEQHRCGCFTL
ncbi:hypothetical protein BD769DRAFT_1480604 [Suillus cothurnatus]|nr:hypothetical protein BD769DRAFT_1480604 [Suillus cothurnatus]